MKNGLKVPDMMGNGIKGFGVTFEEYCRQHDDAMYMRVLNKSTEQVARESGYNNAAEYLRAGYVRSAVNGFEMAESSNKKMGIDTREPIEFMEAAMNGYRMKVEKARFMKEPVDTVSLRKMNQLMQTVNLHTLEYFGARGYANVDYSPEVQKTMVSCVMESAYYDGIWQEGGPEDTGPVYKGACVRDMPVHMLSVEDRMSHDADVLSHQMQMANYRVKLTLSEENGWSNIYPLDEFNFSAEDFIPDASGNPSVSGPVFGEVSYMFADNAAMAKEIAKELYPQTEGKAPQAGSALAKALMSGNEMESRAAMESNVVMDYS